MIMKWPLSQSKAMKFTNAIPPSIPKKWRFLCDHATELNQRRTAVPNFGRPRGWDIVRAIGFTKLQLHGCDG
jgi:hypothetical protein